MRLPDDEAERLRVAYMDHRRAHAEAQAAKAKLDLLLVELALVHRVTPDQIAVTGEIVRSSANA